LTIDYSDSIVAILDRRRRPLYVPQVQLDLNRAKDHNSKIDAEECGVKILSCHVDKSLAEPMKMRAGDVERRGESDVGRNSGRPECYYILIIRDTFLNWWRRIDEEPVIALSRVFNFDVDEWLSHTARP
jgi:hypothetical protein